MSDSVTTLMGPLASGLSLWRGFGVLCIVLLLLVAGVWLLRRLQRTVQTSSLDLELVGRLGLSPKQYLSVVRVGREFWVIGVTDHSIRYIGEYHGDIEPAKGFEPRKGTFLSALENSVRRLGRAFARKSQPMAEAGR
jgi:flagellar biosynthetic protein FliO